MPGLVRPAYARLFVAMVFFVNGAIFASWASRIPAITTGLGMGPAALAIAVFGLSVGAVVGLPLSAALISRFGSTTITRVALVGYAGALTGTALAPDVASLTVALVGFGIGNGVLDVAMNTAAVQVERHYLRQIMSAFHAMFSFGGLAGALVGASAAGIGAAPALHLPVVALVLLALGLGASFGLLPVSSGREITAKTDWFRFLRRDPRLIALGLLVFCSLLCEGAVYDWSAVYIRDELGGGLAVAPLGFAAFSLSMACCRLVADRIADWVGPVAYVRTAGFLATAGLGLVLLGQSTVAGVIGFGLLGLALAGVVPTLFSAAARTHGEPAPAIAVVSTIGYLGFLAGPALIGSVAAASSLWFAMSALVVLTMGIGAGASVLRTVSDHADWEDRSAET